MLISATSTSGFIEGTSLFSNVFNASITILWFIFIAYWIVSASGNKKTAFRQSGVEWIVRVIFIIIFFLLIWRSSFFPRELFLSSTAIKALGVAICGLGIAFAIWARYVLGTNWSRNPEIKVGHELVTSGPYRVVRHPIYTGIFLAFMGSSLVDGRLRDIVLLALIAIGFLMRSRAEERLMMRQFPEAYPEYKKRVKALIPFLF